MVPKRGRWRGLLAGAAGAAMVVGGRAGAETRILFAATNASTASYELFSVNETGGDLRQITTNAYPEWCPALAADTNRVAFLDPSLTTSNLFITTLRGTARVGVGNTNRAVAVQWSGSNELHYLRYRTSFTAEVWRIRTDGSGETRVYDSPLTCWPMGHTAFHVHAGLGRVYVTAFSNSPSRILSSVLGATAPTDMLMTTNVDHYGPAVSPDGTKIAYAADMGEGNHQLYMNNRTGGAEVRLYSTFCGNPSWAPDGTWLAFTRAPVSTFGGAVYRGHIFRVATNGTGAVDLTPGFPPLGCLYPTVYTASEAPGPLPPPFRITGFSVAGETAVLTWEGTNGVLYDVRGAAGMTGAPVWSPVPPATNQPGSNGPMVGVFPVGTGTAGVFRVYGSTSP